MGRFLSPSIDAKDAMSCMFNLRAISQAGRRRFEPGLPLHLFNNLGTRTSRFTACYLSEGEGGGRNLLI